MQQPPQQVIYAAVDDASFSPCRSKRGAAIFRGDEVAVIGRNFKPAPFECDGSEACKATCRRDAVHAEQAAIVCCGDCRDADMLHVKVVNGRLVPSGPPSCVQCSKLMLVVGIRFMWLFHETGWQRYGAEEFHRLSLQNDHAFERAELSAAWRAMLPQLECNGEPLADAIQEYGRRRIDANRLCDRQLGGTYEEDCRRAIAVADQALREVR